MRRRYFDPETTAAIYENPKNGWREGVPKLAWLWMLLFGIFYMGVRSLWLVLGITLAIYLVTITVAFPLIFLVAPLVWVVTSVKVQDLARANYMRMGWNEIDPYEQDGAAI